MVGRKKSPDLLTPLELEIMQVLWQVGPANVQTVQAALQTDPALAYTTVQTMLNILHRKGKVKRTLRGRALDYAPTVSREKATVHAVRELVDRLFGGSVDGLLMSLVKTHQVDLAKVAELTRRLDSEAKSGEEIRHESFDPLATRLSPECSLAADRDRLCGCDRVAVDAPGNLEV